MIQTVCFFPRSIRLHPISIDSQTGFLYRKLMSSNNTPIIRLKPKREGPVYGGHPWVFSGAIATIKGNPADGDVVRVENSRGDFAGWGLFNSRSQIRVRMYSLQETERLDDGFWKKKIQQALNYRQSLPGEASGRLIFSEGDGLSGLTVDRYGDNLVVQFTSLALARRMDTILNIIEEALHPKGITLRTEQGIRQEEGLEIADGVLRGSPDDTVMISENGIEYEVNLATGQKTGFYHDQRENRLRVRDFASGRDCLDMCTYTGGFALNMARGGAKSVLGIDVSASALEIAERNATRNHLSGMSWRKADAFSILPELKNAGQTYDLIVLDPPKFTRSKGSETQAIRGYQSLNEMAMRILRPNGFLVTCSCSGRITREMFREIVQHAGLRAGRTPRIIEQRGASMDHPVNPSCPETEYLKCFILSVE